MGVFKSYSQGITEATRLPKMIAVLWLMNLVFASMAFLVFNAAFRGTLGDSLAAADLLKKTDMNVIFEFLSSSGIVLGEIGTVVLILLAFHVLASVFAFGGILSILDPAARGQRFGQAFFGGGGKFYGRFFRLTIYSLVLWVPAILVFMIVSALLGLATKDPTHEQLAFVLTVLKLAFLVFLIFLVKMILDYARIKIAATDSREVFRSLVGAARFVLIRPVKTLVLYYLLGLTGWAALAAYLALQSTFSKTSAVALVTGFLIAQVFIASRAWLKIAYQSAEKDLWQSASQTRTTS
jgi:hypothetical protein